MVTAQATDAEAGVVAAAAQAKGAQAGAGFVVRDWGGEDRETKQEALEAATEAAVAAGVQVDERQCDGCGGWFHKRGIGPHRTACNADAFWRGRCHCQTTNGLKNGDKFITVCPYCLPNPLQDMTPAQTNARVKSRRECTREFYEECLQPEMRATPEGKARTKIYNGRRSKEQIKTSNTKRKRTKVQVRASNAKRTKAQIRASNLKRKARRKLKAATEEEKGGGAPCCHHPVVLPAVAVRVSRLVRPPWLVRPRKQESWLLRLLREGATSNRR
jgi:hypothetical protein